MNLSNGFKEILMKMPVEKRRDYINKIVADTRSNHPLAEHIRAELAQACLELRKEAAEE